MTSLIILGAGGHGRVVADAAAAGGQWKSIKFLDDRFPKLVSSGGIEVIGRINLVHKMESKKSAFVIAIGDARLRENIVEDLSLEPNRYASIIHPSSIVAESVNLGAGVMILAGAIINSGSYIGDHSIVNTTAVVEHDCDVAEYSHLSPRATLGGEVKVGRRSWLGIGATVLPRLNIAADVTVGAGAVVVRNCNAGGTYIGIPASSKKR